jgi:hypothetical protein
MCEHYQGWTNYETWLTDLWLNNEEYSYDVLCKAMRQPSPARQAKWLEERVRWALNERTSEACLWSDLLTMSIGRVNWLEIVENQD